MFSCACSNYPSPERKKQKVTREGRTLGLAHVTRAPLKAKRILHGTPWLFDVEFVLYLEDYTRAFVWHMSSSQENCATCLEGGGTYL